MKNFNKVDLIQFHHIKNSSNAFFLHDVMPLTTTSPPPPFTTTSTRFTTNRGPSSVLIESVYGGYHNIPSLSLKIRPKLIVQP